METIIQLFERLQWWQRPLVEVLPFLLAALMHADGWAGAFSRA